MLIDETEFDRWMGQAEHTLQSGARDETSGDYDWACFKYQQAGEYATKALVRCLGRPSPGHSILRLLVDLQQAGLEVSQAVLTDARELDRHYIPPRYPDAYPSGIPYEYYDAQVSARAREAARKIVDFVRRIKYELEQGRDSSQG